MQIDVDISIPGQPPTTYTIHIGPSASARLWPVAARLAPGRTPVVITDETVARLHVASLIGGHEPRPAVVALPPGEDSKSLASAAHVYAELARLRFERSDVLVAFGGGVIGDLAGFVAATWMRGVPFVQAPTTLEAAVDAAVGGKAGVNHAAGKNLIGAFHQPRAVFIDTNFLRTLPQRDFAAGLAESVKHAAIRDRDFVQFHADHAAEICARDDGIVSRLIERNCRIKAAVVAADERESGLRAILNHGHTIGHALECCLGYELRHGECVALGMQVENEIARRRGWLSDGDATWIAGLLTVALGLPSEVPRPIDNATVLNATRLDKKNRAGAVGYVLLRGLGKPQIVHDVTDAEVAAALAIIQPQHE